MPYDVTWNAVAAVLLVAGIVLWTVTARRAGRPGAPTGAGA
ncbi:hypothetical protein [Nocardiopsis tropica]|uniref:Uncharacterized protein n=1 Tax=Nocardiopsis tropica TaxID=109330 RepID=A0ABU7KXT6_9ACTN|nr:hypothetical protein [Nocardiopsis umidischolae]MEE2054130.1 hypothetical protein [Nocardiopsis umidischolae]